MYLNNTVRSQWDMAINKRNLDIAQGKEKYS